MLELPLNRFVVIASIGMATTLLVGCNKSATTQPEGVAPSGAAATVNGEKISLTDYYDHMGAKQTAQVMTGNGASEVRVVGSFGLQSLQELVDQKILLQMAKEQGVAPTEGQIDAELKLQTVLRPDYVQVLEDEGLTLPLIRHELEVGLAREHLITKGVTVDSAEVQKYIKDHPDKFSDPAKAKVLVIQINSAAMKGKIDSALASGKNFGEVAVQYSQAPRAKQTGAAFGTDIVSQMPPSLQEIVKKTAEKGTSDWMPYRTSYFKFFVDTKTPAHLQKPTDAQTQLVLRSLALEKGRTKNDFDRTFFEKLKLAKVEVTVPNLKDPWAKAWNQLSSGNGPRQQ